MTELSRVIAEVRDKVDEVERSLAWIKDRLEHYEQLARDHEAELRIAALDAELRPGERGEPPAD